MGMTNRSLILASIVTLEVLVVAGMVAAIRGGEVAKWVAPSTQAAVIDGDRLVEGGDHRTFEAGAHPVLTVDIGYADLTIRAGEPGRFDASLSSGRTLSLGPAATIVARKDGDGLRIEKTSGAVLSAGDMRRVTVLVPPETRVEVGEAGEIEAYGLRGEASFNSVGNGKIRVEDFNAPRLHVETSDGRIVLTDITTPHIEAIAKDGRIEGSVLSLRDGNIESDDGRIQLGFAPGADTLVSADGSDGSVRTFKFGAGSGRLSVHADDGSVSIH